MGRVFSAAVIVWGLLLSSICLGYSGGSGTAGEPYRIATKADLLELAGTTADYDKCFILMADIDMAGQVFTTAIIAADTSSSSGFQGTAFTGTFDGNNLKITNFTINGGSNSYLGLFGYISGGSVKNLGLENCNVNGSSGSQYVGGLAGDSEDGSISNCYSMGGINGGQVVGGLVGYHYAGSINNCYSMGDVNGSQSVGGLVGYHYDGIISNCYSTCTVSGTFAAVGGLVGYNDSGSISNSYSRGNVSGSSPSSSRDIGGLVGNNDGGSIVYCYSTGKVSGFSYIGGLIGSNNMGVDNSFWDVNSSGQASSAGGTGKTTAEMQTRSTFTDAGWDFVGEVINGSNDIWDICDGKNYPKLAWQIPLAGDFVCPDGVDFYDFAVFANQWLLKEIPADVWPEGGDGIVNFYDWAVFANQWQITVDIESLADFAEQWLKTGTQYCIADIAPDGGDGIVNMADFAAFANNWLKGF